MVVWFSTWALGNDLEHQLACCGWSRWTADLDDLPVGALVLYAPPDQLLGTANGSLDAACMLASYRRLFHCPQRLISTWRLQACSEQQLRQGLPPGPEAPAAWPQPETLAALISHHILGTTPGLLDAYLDLELKADLLGGEPDLHYSKRLLAELDATTLLAAWREPQALKDQLNAAQQEVSEARKEAEISKLQLHSVQEELKAAKQEVSEARKEAESSMLQLHNVQEELEHYFLLSRSQNNQLDRYDSLLCQGEALLSRALSPLPVG